MEAFEYLSVLISIVLGLGITQLLLGFSRWLEQRNSFKAYGPAIAWSGFLLLVHLQTWWSMFGLRGYAEWNFLQFSIVLLQPILLFLLAVLVFPGPSAPHRDLRRNFLDQRRWFFGLLIALLVVSLLKDLIRGGSLPSPLNIGFHLAFLVMAGWGSVGTQERVHRILAYTTLSLFVAYVAILFADL